MVPKEYELSGPSSAVSSSGAQPVFLRLLHKRAIDVLHRFLLYMEFLLTLASLLSIKQATSAHSEALVSQPPRPWTCTQLHAQGHKVTVPRLSFEFSPLLRCKALLQQDLLYSTSIN